MQLVPSKQFTKYSNSVSTVQSCEGKAMLYLHVCIECVTAFVTIKLPLFHVVSSLSPVAQGDIFCV